MSMADAPERIWTDRTDRQCFYRESRPKCLTDRQFKDRYVEYVRADRVEALEQKLVDSERATIKLRAAKEALIKQREALEKAVREADRLLELGHHVEASGVLRAAPDTAQGRKERMEREGVTEQDLYETRPPAQGE